MPVLILAGAEDVDLVRPLAARLLVDGGEVRGYLDDDDFELRNMGCKLAIGALDDEGNLEAALTNVHTFIPILTDPAGVNDQAGLDRLVDFGLAAAHAAGAAEIAQTILPVSLASASDGPLGEALVRMENEFRESVHPLCVLRTGLLWGPSRPLPACIRALGRSGQRFSNDDRIQVVQVEDFVALLAAADDREGLQGAWALPGEDHSVRELQELAGEGDSKEPGKWLAGILTEGLAGAAKLLENTPPAVDQFNLKAGRAQALNSAAQARTGGHERGTQ